MNYDQVSGWDRTTTSPLGGQRGKHIDEAIAEVTAINPTIGALLHPFVFGRFWDGPDKIFSIGAYDPTRYVIPDDATLAALGLNSDQAQQIVWNEQGRTNFYAALAFGDTAGFVTAIYRGVPGGIVMPKYDPTGGGSFVPTGPDAPLTPTQAAQKAMTFPNPRPYELIPGIGGHMWPQPINDQMAGDHFLADIWFDLTTDVNVARLYRQFAIAYGVNIAAEPTP